MMHFGQASALSRVVGGGEMPGGRSGGRMRSEGQHGSPTIGHFAQVIG